MIFQFEFGGGGAIAIVQRNITHVLQLWQLCMYNNICKSKIPDEAESVDVKVLKTGRVGTKLSPK